MGYEPSLDAVRQSGATGVGAAFTQGLQFAFFAMMGSLLVALFLSALPTHREGQAVPAPPAATEPVLRPATSQGQED